MKKHFKSLELALSGYLKRESQVGFIVIKAKSEFFFNNNIVEPKSTYTYDALYRLKTATGRELTSLQMPTHTDFVNNIPVPNTASNAIQTYNQEFTYDELGNITEMKSVGNWTRDYYYDFANNRNYLLGHSSGTTTYTYDKHGNMLSMSHLTSMVWDHRDQLIEVTLNASNDKAYYVYDASGERVRKVIEKTGGIVEDRKYLGGFEIYKKTVSGSVDTERETIHISDDQKKILSVDTLIDGLGNDLLISNFRYQYDNHLGSATLELDESASIISYEEYHPFGTTSYRSGKTETEVSRKRYKYVGKERDEETGLYYYGARYYTAWVARFVSIDPLQHKYPHYTPFQYAGNKPISYIDLDGLEELKLNALIPDLIPEQMDVGYRVYNPPADNTYMARTPNNFRLLTSADLLVGSIAPKEQPVLGPYNPTGMNEDYLKAVDKQVKMQVQFEERLNEQQNRSPLMFGNPGQPHGAGLYSSLEKGYEIGSAIEGGYGVYKLGVGLTKVGAILLSSSKNSTNIIKWGWSSLHSNDKNAKWVSPKQGVESSGLRDHFIKHGDQVGAKSAREYDLSSRLTIQNGRKFSYRDPSSNAKRVGYWDESTGLLTGTNQTRGTTTILTHYPLS